MLHFIHWNADPILIELGPLAIRWYGLLFAMSFVAGYQLMARIYRQEGVKQEELDKLVMYVAVGTVLGARLGHCFFYDFDYYIKHPLEILQIWKGGLASHGAAIGILISLYLFVKKASTRPYLWVVDRVVITVALAAFMIRLGNLMNSEIIGSPSDVPWAFIFHKVDEVPRHPSQLYESISYLLIFLILFGIYRKKKQDTPGGLLFGLFLVMMFTLRFFMEFIKDVQVEFENDLPLKMGQFLSIPLVIAGVIILARSLRTRN